MIKKIFLAEDKFMPEMHLRQRGFMYSARRPFKQKKETTSKHYLIRHLQLLAVNSMTDFIVDWSTVF